MSIAIAIVVSVLIYEALNLGVGLTIGARGWDLLIGMATVHLVTAVGLALAFGVTALWGWAL